MSDWSARVGILLPSVNTVLERDAATSLPPGVSAHFARLKWRGEDRLAELAAEAPVAAELLADAGVDAIAFGCTTGSLDGGEGYDQRIIELVESATGVPTTTTASALIEALSDCQARTVALVSPYEASVNNKVVRFLAAHGVAVKGSCALAIRDPEMAAVPPARIAEAVYRIDSTQVDAIVISCTAFRGVEAIALIGARLGKPVLSSNQVTFWKLAQMIAGRLPPR